MSVLFKRYFKDAAVVPEHAEAIQPSAVQALTVQAGWKAMGAQ